MLIEALVQQSLQADLDRERARLEQEAEARNALRRQAQAAAAQKELLNTTELLAKIAGVDAPVVQKPLEVPKPIAKEPVDVPTSHFPPPL